MSDLHPSNGPAVLTVADLDLVEEIFSEVLEAAPPARPALMATRCGEAVAIRAEVEALLAAHVLASSVMRSVDDAPSAAGRPLGSGAVVGRYRLLEKIGEGGMGEVHLAERADGLFEHRVAVKIVRAAPPAADLARRFIAERQILASLQHPHIVTLIDAGSTDNGQAYLVMEFVAGLPITVYCRERALTLDARVALLIQVCRAVQYAHQRAIVHRDLKPANILVTDDVIPKVLDFGIAKLLEGSEAGTGTVTSFLPGPLTPNYASPEQLRGLPVTTACDVYSLGVLAYQVVSGSRPYETGGCTLDKVLDIVLETDPVRPSVVPASADPAGDAHAHATAWRRRLRGDLDAIVLKAMSKEPERRYGSAGELADDLERFLTSKPVVAREPSAAYMLRRLAGRNKAAVTVAAASLLLILAALTVALWQRHVAVVAQARAEQRFREVRQLANTLIFKIHDAVAPLAGSTPVRKTIVSEGLAYLERLGEASAGDPSLDRELAEAYRQIGRILGSPSVPNLGDRAGALKQFEKSRALAYPLATRPEASFEDIRTLVNTDQAIGSLLAQSGQRDRANQMAQEALEQAERAYRLPGKNAGAAELLAQAAFYRALTTDPSSAAVPYWQQAVGLYDQVLAERPNDPVRQRNVALSEKYLGGSLDWSDRDEEAERHYRRALELDERRYAQDPENRLARFDLAIDLANMATMTEGKNRFDEAYAWYSRSLDLRQKLSASDPTDALAKGRIGYVQTRLAKLDIHRGHFGSALASAREAVRIQESVVAATGDLASRRELVQALHILGQAQAGAGATAVGCATERRALHLVKVLPLESSEFKRLAGEVAAQAAACGG